MKKIEQDYKIHWEPYTTKAGYTMDYIIKAGNYFIMSNAIDSFDVLPKDVT